MISRNRRSRWRYRSRRRTKRRWLWAPTSVPSDPCLRCGTGMALRSPER
ncbi:unnamed protein product [Oppiella nova]|uniref:Uncharacterized protein n=1 Tax=Oppiella nova TaxID=334625 RepID=A0A7R9QYL7_9ACAR|nr:unnamed protein product [Oppiella nova]CAG2179173.1 unnamed protein product [Oppiella nova]